eukprot:TRINITY_DN13609_c0_g1_i1.p1 TRINITY_DN13609_c0_g1~~TRINITY_DN13609_c0_g1_i1.p1  ORF type:complete len:261 (-),score=38.72 TRINITY_DN13609_c0_g1_i1:4-786(-)
MFTTDYGTNFFVEIVFDAQHEIHASQLLDELSKYISNKTSDVQKDESHVTFFIESLETLGQVVCFLFLNRPPIPINIYLLIPTQPSPTAQPIKNGLYLHPINLRFGTDLEKDLPSIQGYPHQTVDPTDRIEVFHLHAHFNEQTEKIALAMQQELIEHIKTNLHSPVTSEIVYHEKNGPHDKWSWEIHVPRTHPTAYAGALVFLMVNRQPDIPHPFHCRTYDIDEKNEYNDHAFRMSWVGEPDPDPLDIDFFKKHWHQDAH